MKKNKGFGLVAVLLIIVAVLAVGGIAYYAGKSSKTVPVVEENNLPQENQNSALNVPVVNSDATNQTSESSNNVNGKYIGYLKSISSKNGASSLIINYVQWLTGKDAIKAALEDNKCSIEGKSNSQAITELANYDMSNGFGIYGICAPDGYYIRNQNSLLRTFPISNTTTITTLPATGGPFPTQSSLNSLKTLIKSKTWTNSNPFWITLDNGIITDITEQYVP